MARGARVCMSWESMSMVFFDRGQSDERERRAEGNEKKEKEAIVEAR